MYKRDNLGFIDLDALGCTLIKNQIVIIDGHTYYYKDSTVGAFKELVVDELAKGFNFKCAFYDLASFDGRCGLISKDLDSDGQSFMPMEDLLSIFLDTKNYITLSKHNNLDDIGLVLSYYYPEDVVQRLLSQLDELYLFDLMIGNPDRNCSNYGLVTRDGVVDVVIFDNELAFDTDVLYDDKNLLRRKGNGKDDPNDVSSSFVKEKLKLISDDNIERIFGQVEAKIGTPINSGIKSEFRTFFRRSGTLLSKRFSNSNVKQV